jgi:hypothetical protein
MNWTGLPIVKYVGQATQCDARVRSRPGTPFLESTFRLAAVDHFGSGNELLCLLNSNARHCAAAIIPPEGGNGVRQTLQASQRPLRTTISNGKIDLQTALTEAIELAQVIAEIMFSRARFYGKVIEWHDRRTTHKRTIFHATACRRAGLRQSHRRLPTSAAQSIYPPLPSEGGITQ